MGDSYKRLKARFETAERNLDRVVAENETLRAKLADRTIRVAELDDQLRSAGTRIADHETMAQVFRSRIEILTSDLAKANKLAKSRRLDLWYGLTLGLIVGALGTELVSMYL